MLLYRFVYLFLIEKLSKERTINSVYHLLQGKKSIQTIQDAHLFNIEQFYAINKNLTKQSFENVLKSLEKDQWIKKQSETSFTLTDKGHLWLKENHSLLNGIYFRGWTHQKIASEFFKRLQLIVQIWTNKYKSNMKFIPVIEDNAVKNWSKHIYQLTQKKTETYLMSLYEELDNILNNFEAKPATIFVKQLSSYQYTGMTTDQLAQQYELNPAEVIFTTENIIHYILNQVRLGQDDFPVLYLLSYQDEPLQEVRLNESTMKTKVLFEQGYAMDQIIQLRRLKESTIHDHLIEIAYSSAEFPFNRFFNPSDYRLVNDIIEQIQSYQLKKIKAMADEALTYFQIRLIIAAIHHNK